MIHPRHRQRLHLGRKADLVQRQPQVFHARGDLNHPRHPVHQHIPLQFRQSNAAWGGFRHHHRIRRHIRLCPGLGHPPRLGVWIIDFAVIGVERARFGPLGRAGGGQGQIDAGPILAGVLRHHGPARQRQTARTLAPQGQIIDRGPARVVHDLRHHQPMLSGHFDLNRDGQRGIVIVRCRQGVIGGLCAVTGLHRLGQRLGQRARLGPGRNGSAPRRSHPCRHRRRQITQAHRGQGRAFGPAA